jgi:hypothetical protein
VDDSLTSGISSRENDIEQRISSIIEDNLFVTIFISSESSVPSAEEMKTVIKKESSVTDDIFRSIAFSRYDIPLVRQEFHPL